MANNLRDAFVVQGRVILALMLRESRTRYGRQKAGYLWALIEPILHVSFFYFIFAYRLTVIPLGDNLFIFLATGFAVFIGFRNIMSRTQGSYGSNESLLAYPNVHLMDVFLGRGFLELATWVVVMIIIFGTAMLLGYGHVPNSILKMLTAISALFAVGFSMGICLGILGEFWPSVNNLLNLPMRLLYFASGLFFLPDTLPPGIRSIFYWNPVLHGITLFREGYYRGYQSHILDLNYLAGWALGSMLLAAVVVRIARRPIRNLA